MFDDSDNVITQSVVISELSEKIKNIFDQRKIVLL